MLQHKLLFHLIEREAVGDTLADSSLQVFEELDRQRNVGFREEITMAAGEGVEVQRIDCFIGLDPVGNRMAIQRSTGTGQ